MMRPMATGMGPSGTTALGVRGGVDGRDKKREALGWSGAAPGGRTRPNEGGRVLGPRPHYVFSWRRSGGVGTHPFADLAPSVGSRLPSLREHLAGPLGEACL